MQTVDRRASMVDRPGAVLRFLFRNLFAEIQFGDAEAERVREAAARGPVVYVLRTVSYIEYLYFNYVLRRHGLPLARFANGGVRTILLWPVRIAFALLVALWRLARGARLEAEEETVARTVAKGEAVLLFLRASHKILGEAGAAQRVRGRFFETLIDLQRRLAGQGTSLQLVPMTLVWGHPAVRPGSRGAIAAIFGQPETPGRLRGFLQFVRHHRSSVVKVAEPIDLPTFLAAESGRTEDAVARTLRFELSGRIERERRVILGPQVKSPARVSWDVMRSRRLVATIDRLAAAPGGPTRDQLAAKARKQLAEIAATPKSWMFQGMRRLLALVFGRIYEGIDVDEEDLERLREAAKLGPLVLLPSHKSHIDYLVLSYVFYEHGLAPPHIAAGANLSFFPMGPIFRRCAAFFLRRSFRGDELYSAVFSAYVRRLMRDRFSLEFFVEGGRSRTGKVLAPKLGLLGIVADAVLDGEAPNAQAVPIAITYEKIVEGGSYARERAGGEKKKENLGALLRAGRVLRSKYGRIDISIGAPFALKQALEEAGGLSGEDGRRQAVRRLGHRVVYSIAQATAVTPTALIAAASLATGARAVARRDLDRRIVWLAERAQVTGARFAASIHHDFEGAVGRAIDLLASDGDLELRGQGDDQLVVVVDERRPRLEYYKNNAIHALSDASIVARAVLAAGGDADAATVRRLALTTSRLLKNELHFRPGSTFDSAFSSTLAELEVAGWVKSTGDRIAATLAGAEPLAVLAGLTASYLESYRTAARTAAANLTSTPKELTSRMIGAGERQLLLGAVVRRESISRPIYESAVAYLRAAELLGNKDKLAALLAEIATVA